MSLQPPTPVETPETTPLPESTSVAAHEAQFKHGAAKSPDVTDDGADDGDARDVNGRFIRHRAQSQKAKPEDVAEIGKLTKELRAKEQELAKIRPDSVSGSPRLTILRRQIKAIEAELGESQAKPVEPQPVETSKTELPANFDEKEPTIDDFVDATKYPDPYLALNRALGAYDRRKEAFEAKQAEGKVAEQTRIKGIVDGYRVREAAFTKLKPDYPDIAKAFEKQIVPALLAHAMLTDDKGPEYVYYLGQHQDVLDELVLLTEGKAVTDASVAVVQRRLKQSAQAAQSTGSAAVTTPPYTPPKPPNPVRTGPIKAADELPDDTASIAEHAKHFLPKRR